METLKTEVFPGGRRATYWLIVERGRDRPAALTVGTSPELEALAVSSFREEALLFLSVQGFAEGWTVTEVATEELISVLLDSRPARVALDPLPGGSGREDGRSAEHRTGAIPGRYSPQTVARRGQFTLRPRVRRVGGRSGGRQQALAAVWHRCRMGKESPVIYPDRGFP